MTSNNIYKKAIKAPGLLYRLLLWEIRQTWEDRFLSVRVGILLIFFRVTLRLVPVNKLYRVVNIFLQPPLYSHTSYMEYTRKVIGMVERSGYYLLRSKCMAQALAVHMLLNRRRIFSSIYIGFVRREDVQSAHAWVQAEDKILTGEGNDLQYYFRVLLPGVLTMRSKKSVTKG